MQTVDCVVAINGDMRNTVARQGVTIPELMLLRELHGADAVRHIQVVGKVASDSAEERERLAGIYTKPAGIVREVLGATGPLPKTLKEAGISDEFVVAAPEGAGGKRKASATQELKVPTEGDKGGEGGEGGE